MTSERYTHGHHESVLRSHRSRTVENSAAYLRDYLRDGIDLLDVGCGPGTITADFARLMPASRVLGVDASREVVAAASDEFPPSRFSNLAFDVADVYDLPFDSDSFDLVHAHQVLQHLGDPVGALKEMRRVARPGGVVAARDVDFGVHLWYPESERMTRWLALYHEITRRNGAEADAGRRLGRWAQLAGFESWKFTTSTWTYASDEARRWWAQLWFERMTNSAVAEQAIDYGLASAEELEDVARGFFEVADDPAGFFGFVHGEIIADA